VAILEEVKKAAITYGVATAKEIEEISNDHSLAKLGVEDLEGIKKYLQDYLNDLEAEL
jgi:hypothetical protein